MEICKLVNLETTFMNYFVQSEELKDAVKPEFFPWLSQYLVMKRVSIEPNFHDLYIKFLETLKMKELFQMVLQETYRNIKVLKWCSWMFTCPRKRFTPDVKYKFFIFKFWTTPSLPLHQIYFITVCPYIYVPLYFRFCCSQTKSRPTSLTDLF